MFVQQLNGDLDEVLDERSGQKPKKPFMVSKDERGFKRMTVPLAMMDADDGDNSRSIAATKEAAYQKYCARTRDAWKGNGSPTPKTETPVITGTENYVTGSGRKG